jgi:hypothetical protein
MPTGSWYSTAGARVGESVLCRASRDERTGQLRRSGYHIRSISWDATRTLPAFDRRTGLSGEDDTGFGFVD